MKKQKLELRDVLALFSAFGPQAQQERETAQKTAQLQQLAQLVGLARGAQELGDAPAESALRRRAGEAGINATETSTRLAAEKLPVELEGLRAQIAQAQQSGALSTEQLAQLKALFPMQQQLLGSQVETAKVAAADAPNKIKREMESQQSEIDYRKTAGEAAKTSGVAALAPHLDSLVTLAQGTGTGKPGELPMGPEVRQAIMARLLQSPELAQIFGNMGVQRQALVDKAKAAVAPSAPYDPKHRTMTPKFW